jgi:hypothetical protein
MSVIVIPLERGGGIIFGEPLNMECARGIDFLF